MELIDSARKAIWDAEAVVILAGAGMGVDSGLPDFRGNEGFWNAYPPYRKLGVSFVEMANPAHFSRDPEFGWGFYGHRQNLYRETEPHAGFQRLLNFAESRPAGYFVFTSNVDGHFQKAGFLSNHILECHGSIHHLQCCQQCGFEIWESPEDTRLEIDMERMRAVGPLPVCPACGSLARPNILMFGDWDWDSGRTGRQQAAFSSWLQSLDRQIRLAVIEFGAGSGIPTVRNQSERLAAAFPNSILVRVNPREADIPATFRGSYSLSMGAAAATAHLF